MKTPEPLAPSADVLSPTEPRKGTESPTASTEAVPLYPSMTAMRAVHSDLLRRKRHPESLASFVEQVKAFIRCAQATGVLLDTDADRSEAQALIDYWVTTLYRETRQEQPEAILAEFDQRVQAIELSDEQYPYKPYEGTGDTKDVNRNLLIGTLRHVEACLGRIEKNRLLAVVGPNGSGRTSLVEASILPALREGQLPGSAHWRYFPIITPGPHPPTRLVSLVQPPGVQSEEWIRQQVEAFQDDPRHLAKLIAEAGDEPIVLTIDRFEEVFTTLCSKQERQAFFDNLLGLVRGPNAVHVVILIMDSDSLSKVDHFEAFQAVFQNGLVYLAFNTDEFRQAIERPAELVGLKFDEGLVDRLILDIQGDPAALTLLQFTLRKLWENRDQNRITWDAYNRLGGGRLALERTAERVYKNLKPPEQAIARWVFMQLVHPGMGQKVIVRRVEREALRNAGPAPAQVDHVLNQFLREGLLQPANGAAGHGAQVTLAHEALVGHWPRLLDWLSVERDEQRRRLRLTAAAEQWRETTDPSTLWGPSLVQEAERYRNLSALELQFLRASRAAIEAEELAKEAAHQRQITELHHRQLALIIVLLVVGGLLAISYWFYRDAATKNRLLEAAEAGRKVQTEVEKGLSLLESGDVSGALLRFTEALNAETQDEARKRLQRLRVGTALGQLSRPAQIFLHEKLANAEASRDGLSVVTVGDGRARLWDARTGLPLMETLGDDANPINAAVFSPDSRRIVFARGKAASDQGQAEVWDLNSKKLIVSLDHEGAVNCATFSNNGRRLVTGSEVANGRRGEALIWDGATYQKLQRLPHARGGVTWVGFSYDGKRLATGSQEATGDGGEVLVWQVQSDGPPPPASPSRALGLGAFLPGQGPVFVASALAAVRSERLLMRGLHRKGVSFAAFCPPESRLLVSVSSDAGEAKVWNVETGQTVLVPDHKGPMTNADFSPDGGLLVTTSHDGTAKVWEVIEGTRIPPLPLLTLEHGSSVFHASFTPGGRFLITSSRDQAARIWELATGKPLVPLLSHTGTVSSARFSSDARQVLTVGPDTAQIWEVATRNPILPVVRAGDSLNYAALSPDTQLLVTASGARGSEAGVAEIWDVNTGESRIAPVKLKGALTYAAFNFDSSQLVTVCQPAKGGKSSVQIWRLADRKMVMVQELPTAKWPGKGAVTCSAFSHDGQRVALASELDDPAGKKGEVWIWNTAHDDFTPCAPQVGKPAHDEPVTSVAFNPQDSRLATTSTDDTARLWDAATGALRATLKHTADVSHAVFSPDGQLVITVGTDRKAKFWPAEIMASGGQKAEPAAVLNHSGYLNHAAFSADGRRIATAAQDGTVRVWDVASKELIAVLRHRGNVRHVAFSPAGDKILATSYDVPTQIRARDRPAGMDLGRGQVHTRLWGLADFDQSSIADLGLYAQVLSARKYDPKVLNVVPIEGKELDQLWRQLKNDGREFPFGRPMADPHDPKEIAWHERRAQEAKDAKEWFAAAWHLSQLLDVEAEKAPLLARRAEAFSRLPRWRGQANSDYSEALRLAPQNWQLWAGRADTFYYLSQWDQAVQDYTKAIELQPENAELWQSRAQTYAVLHRWKEVAEDSSRAIELDPKKWVPWSIRAQALAELGDQDKARPDYAKAIELGADQAGVWYALALLHLAKNDRQAYRGLCQQMLARFAGTEDPATANDVAWTCVLDPESVTDWSQPLRLVDKAVAGVSEPQATYYYLNTLGAVLYRAGDTSAALKRLQEAMSAFPGQQGNNSQTAEPSQRKLVRVPVEAGTAWDWLFLAMAHHRLGHADEARKWLDKALKGSDEDTYSSWTHRLEFALLRKEAQALLGGKS